jgi:hypothetical protein
MRFLSMFPVAAAILMGSATAHADSIDGNWCHDLGKRMTISGSTIVTPAGSRTIGNYGRHDFSYVVPVGDPGAGTKIEMVLMGELRVQVKEGNAPPVIWNRCGPSIS